MRGGFVKQKPRLLDLLQYTLEQINGGVLLYYTPQPLLPSGIGAGGGRHACSAFGLSLALPFSGCSIWIQPLERDECSERCAHGHVEHSAQARHQLLGEGGLGGRFGPHITTVVDMNDHREGGQDVDVLADHPRDFFIGRFDREVVRTADRYREHFKALLGRVECDTFVRYNF